MNNDNDWKLNLKHGKLTTPYKHYTITADGIAQNIAEGFSCPDGKAYIGMKVWASSSEEAIDMVQSIGADIGFTVTGTINIYNTDPEEPPSENPSAYGINFHSYNE
jgi:hypothetical protein